MEGEGEVWPGTPQSGPKPKKTFLVPAYNGIILSFFYKVTTGFKRLYSLSRTSKYEPAAYVVRMSGSYYRLI